MVGLGGPAAGIVDFAHLLRRVGLRVSTAEVIDALQALSLVDPADRAQVRAALRAALVKEIRDVAAFEEAFAAFFSSPAARREIARQAVEAAARRREELAAAEADLRFQGEPLSLSEEEKLLYAGLAKEDKERLKGFLAATSAGKNVDHHFRPLVTSLVRSQLAFLRRRGRVENGAPWPAAAGEEDPLAHWVRRNCGLWRQDVKEIAAGDLPRARDLVAEMSRRLAARICRRYRRATRVGAVDLRRSFRANLRHGGALFRISFRRRRPARPRLLLLCDVSGSMASYSTFTLQLLYGLGRAVGRSRCFLFAERLVELDLASWARTSPSALAETLEERQAAVGRQTRLDMALEELMARDAELFTRRTVLVVVSDTKTQGAAKAARLLVGLRGRLRAVIWLNPLPEAEWSRYPTVALFRPHVEMLPCRTLGDLERLLRGGFLEKAV